MVAIRDVRATAEERNRVGKLLDEQVQRSAAILSPPLVDPRRVIIGFGRCAQLFVVGTGPTPEGWTAPVIQANSECPVASRTSS